MHTQSVLTITSNVVYGKNTGNTPDGRRKGEPFAPGANPMHGRDSHGILASAASVAKIPYRDAADGISLTSTMIPQGLGRTPEIQVTNLVGLLDSFFGDSGYHMNVNVLNRDMLLDAMDHPEKYPQSDHSRIGLCGELRPSHTRPADGCDQSDVPRAVMVMDPNADAPDVPLVASPYDLRVSLGEKVPDSHANAALESGDFGFVHSFTTGSAVDGPGMRVVVWLTGCHFRCVFCHNPDTWKLKNGIPVPLTRAVEEVRKYRHALRTMKGGLTVSGGEPMLQRQFLIRLFTAVKEMGLHTTVDTNGYLGERLTDADLQACDLVILGMKAFDPVLHRRITGMDNEPVLAFARRLATLQRPMWLRYVLVPGLSDDPDEISRVADFAAGLGNVEHVELLPFHQLGRFKWEQLGTPYELEQTVPPSPEQTEQAMAIFRSRGLALR